MTSPKLESATLAGGCFWCLEAIIERLQGVHRVVSGYSGGTRDRPTYEEVCAGDTGHAEVVQVTFDPAAISYRELLEIFFAFHDPTTLNRQGADVGTQYRSAIFWHDAEQKRLAQEVIDELARAGAFAGPIVTEVTRLEAFHPAEEYHQGYYRAHPDRPYCAATIGPKVAKLLQKYAARLKPRP